jgi:hypothetical protein
MAPARARDCRHRCPAGAPQRRRRSSGCGELAARSSSQRRSRTCAHGTPRSVDPSRKLRRFDRARRRELQAPAPARSPATCGKERLNCGNAGPAPSVYRVGPSGAELLARAIIAAQRTAAASGPKRRSPGERTLVHDASFAAKGHASCGSAWRPCWAEPRARHCCWRLPLGRSIRSCPG